MDNTSEIKENQQRPEKVVSLGEEFQLFDPDRTQTAPDMSGVAFLSNIELILNDNLTIPFGIYAYASKSPKSASITPFNPEAGYQIDSNDLDIETRIKKFEMLQEKNEYIDSAKASNFIAIYNPFERKWPTPHKMLDTFKKLRIQVLFPTSRFESSPNPTDLALLQNEIHFSSFYPFDTGPLPIDDRSQMQKGFYLFLPEDPEKLSQIRARFVLAEEEPKKVK